MNYGRLYQLSTRFFFYNKMANDDCYSDDNGKNVTDLSNLNFKKENQSNNNAWKNNNFINPWSTCKVLLYTSFFIVFIYFVLNVTLSSSTDLVLQPDPLILINYTKANKILFNVCDAVAKGKRTGSICNWLCNANKNYTLTKFYEGGSKIVFKLNRNEKDIILKMRFPYLNEYDPLDSRVDDEEFTNKVFEIVENQIKMGWPINYKSHLIKMLWPSYIANQSFTNAEKQSLWALIQQEEFINLQILKSTRVIPKVLGTCAHIYQVEYIRPFKLKSYYLNLKPIMLMHFMGTLKLFYEFLNEPLQWCDVKFENLGLTTEYSRKFMVIDADMLYTKSKLNYMLSTRNCSNDKDCMFFDCNSKCNNVNGLCTTRINDNINIFCEKFINRLFVLSKDDNYYSICQEKTVDAVKRISSLRDVMHMSFFDQNI